MRTLKFIVDKQIISKDPNCDFTGLVPGSEGYIKASFSFSSDWRDSVKVAAFYSPLGIEYEPQILDENKSCLIPAKALRHSNFKIQVIGKSKDGKLTTNKLIVEQKGGK